MQNKYIFINKGHNPVLIKALILIIMLLYFYFPDLFI
jgi:hypothetical protein